YDRGSWTRMAKHLERLQVASPCADEDAPEGKAREVGRREQRSCRLGLSSDHFLRLTRQLRVHISEARPLALGELHGAAYGITEDKRTLGARREDNTAWPGVWPGA